VNNKTLKKLAKKTYQLLCKNFFEQGRISIFYVEKKIFSSRIFRLVTKEIFVYKFFVLIELNVY